MVVTDTSDGTSLLHDHHHRDTAMISTDAGTAGGSGSASKRTSAPWLVATTDNSTNIPGAAVVTNNR
jgi:hypothetical protein